VTVSVAAIRPSAAIYREEQFFAWWLYLILALMAGVGWLMFAWQGPPHPVPGVLARPSMQIPLTLVVGLVLPPALVIGVLRMTTEVTPGVCRVWFGFIPTYRRVIPIDEVKSVEVVRYRVPRDHVFWGVRTTRDGERVLTARGDRGVRLHLTDGSRVLIGSQRPEDLAQAIHGAMRPVA
jgi:hypothetical protein